MGSVLAFMAVVAGVAGWWLSRQRVTARPWLEQGVIDDAPGPPSLPAAKLGLLVFLAVAGSLFALLVGATSLRVGAADLAAQAPWPAATSLLLWLNTGALVLSSAALQTAGVAARRDRRTGVRAALLVAGASSVAFLAGQSWVWVRLMLAGVLPASGPAAAFLYLLTGAHGLHVLGGLVALARTIAQALRADGASGLPARVDLCATYWHFLLLVWLVVFGLINASSWPGWLVAICTGSLS